MNKLLLALIILAAGAGGFLTARQSTTQLRHEANVAREAWYSQTQVVAHTQREQSDERAHVRELEAALARTPTATENRLWSTLQTNRVGHFSRELRERLLQEFAFNWQSSDDFVVVTKDTIWDIRMPAILDRKLTNTAAAVLALTPEERGQVAAALQRVAMDVKDWALKHTQRTEPKDDVVAQYTLQRDRAMTLSISNTLACSVLEALGRQRAELVLQSPWNVMGDLGVHEEVTTLVIRRYSVGNEQQFRAQQLFGNPPWNNPSPLDLSKCRFPEEFLPVFPNGWADVAKREGFELPQKSQITAEQKGTTE